MNETCNTCGVVYAITHGNAQLFLFIEDPLCNHVGARCPSGHQERIYVKPDAATAVMRDCKLGLQLGARADDQLKQSAHDSWARVSAMAELPLAPREWTTELYDSLRNWKGEPL